MRTVTIYATGQCNLRCKHCGVGIDQEKPRRQLGTEDLKVILSRLAASGTKYVTILGGEPTAYRTDLGEILDHASMIGISISIDTNLLLYELVEPLLFKPSLKSLVVSLDGASPATHDEMRGKGTFAETIHNTTNVVKNKRVGSGDLVVEISFVISQINLFDAARMIPLTKRLGATCLHVAGVKTTGRAIYFKGQLAVDYKDLLEANCSLVVTWMLTRAIQMDIYVPPAFALYLQKRFGLNYPIDGHPACGGLSEFGYIDLLGNLLPCPAMSFENDPFGGVKLAKPDLNLVTTDVYAVLQTSMFVDFEKWRAERLYNRQMYPCKYCRFNILCCPCTADIIKGLPEGEVEICSAVLKHGDEHVPGLSDYIFKVPDT